MAPMLPLDGRRRRGGLIAVLMGEGSNGISDRGGGGNVWSCTEGEDINSGAIAVGDSMIRSEPMAMLSACNQDQVSRTPRCRGGLPASEL